MTPCLLHTILHTNLRRPPVFMSNIDLSDVYTGVWISPEDLSQLAFVVPPQPLDNNTLIGFHIYLTMGYVYSALYFCYTNKTLA